jgi:flagellar hook-basal body complex protein FliE
MTMIDPRIQGVGPNLLHSLSRKTEPEAPQKGFLEHMKESVARVETQQQKADQAVQDLATGKRKTLHETMIQVEKAEISFKLLMAVRGKIVNAYQEVMRMHF